jgi:radical SAM superfamily enzyme YgiQ (UPF0313 family)
LKFPTDQSTFGRRWFEIGPIRPPNEGGDCSLLIRATRNCPWNRCLFCRTYQGQKFEYRRPEDVKQDIDAAKSMADDLLSASQDLRLGGQVTNQVLAEIMQNNPREVEEDVPEGYSYQRYHGLINVANWLNAGARTVFLQDGDTPVMRTPDLVEIIHHIKTTFPSVQRITSYARTKTLAHKSQEDLRMLRQAGLSRLHVGLESGTDEVLAYMQKGVTAQEQIEAGQKVVGTGIDLSMYVMPGLGGRRWSQRHALETARVLNAISPHFIRLRTLVPRNGSALLSRVLNGEFEMLSEDEVVGEIRLLIENLDTSAYLSSDQMCNLLGEVEGQIPQQKPAMLSVIDNYLEKTPTGRLRFQLERRLHSHLAVFGRLGPEEETAVRLANQALSMGALDMGTKVEAALSLLKRQFI